MNATYPFLTVLAAGITGSARLHEKLGASEAARAIDRCLKRVGRAVEAFGGRIVRSGGDEVIAEFDTADAVLHAAVEMQQRIGDLPPVSGAKMAIRVGISCGQIPPGQPGRDGLAREAARLAGIAKSGQTLAIGRIGGALPEALRAQISSTGLVLLGESGKNESIVEIDLLEMPAGQELDPAGNHSRSGWLRLRYGGNVIALDKYRPVIDMGRDGACDLVIRDGRASRHHAAIRRRGDLTVLIDRSRNGTYVTMDGDAEQFVKQGECTLHGAGVIAFAASATAPDADCAEFECF
ncbi:MAG: adenylate/guanylate cyclase domain-containing protein [Candidatus Accumulibacter sp.]|nr:adenylate/guanylate cyclase domain-containing protein [Accumulibacter sp.]